MKLGLLVVLVVEVLVPSLSESQIISKCELKEKLGESIEVYLEASEIQGKNCEDRYVFQRLEDKMSVLVVCLLAVLGCSVAEGATVSKCDLKQKLTDKLRDQAEDIAYDVDKLVAKIVCHVEYAAGFNTSAVNDLTIASEHTRRKRSDSGLFGLAEYEPVPTTAHPRNRRHASEASSETIWTLYGLFQLSNHLVCKDSTTETHNICGMDCSELVDDKIEDDLDCVLTLFKLLVEQGFSGPSHLTAMIKLIFQDECINVKPSEYFKECAV
ncbi:hypothetical protein D5F01_LYC00764 [Larimichthys crocea]|uniref:lysozyme n=1 Tax=Larimichthys crocea TaxID=215358 RepID=A0A6G0JA16_LARCR|nr:hypothetical protein D5F01_LYC00764 [Larimichthys crocea]